MSVNAIVLSVADWFDVEWLLSEYGNWMFAAALAMVFIESGVIYPFLPGDAMLFTIGVLVGADKLGIPIFWVCLGLGVAAWLGAAVGYEIGRKLGPPLFHRNGRILNMENYDKTHVFFAKHGNAAIVVSRFVPFVRTFVSMFAGVAEMDRRRYWLWSLVGALAWAVGLPLAGFLLGDIPAVEEHFDVIIWGLLILPLAPLLVEGIRKRRKAKELVAPAAVAATPEPELD